MYVYAEIQTCLMKFKFSYVILLKSFNSIQGFHYEADTMCTYPLLTSIFLEVSLVLSSFT